MQAQIFAGDNRRATLSLKNITTDTDDVLLDWTSGFKPYAEYRLGRKLDGGLNQTYSMEKWLGTTREETEAMILDFNHGDGGFFGRLEGFEDALKWVPRLAAEGRRFNVITSCSSLPKVEAMRRANLEALFGKIFGDIICLDLGVSKADALKAYPDTIWVEDNHANALTGVELGHETFIIRRSHNRTIEETCKRAELIWVDGWDGIVSEISPQLAAA